MITTARRAPLPVADAAARRRFPWFIAGLLTAVLAAMAWRASRAVPTQLLDLYPLYYGAKAWLHGGNAYALDAVAPAADRGTFLFDVGNVYPLPAVLVGLPFSFLPPHAAAVAWVGLLTAGLALALRLHRRYWLLLYFPILHGLWVEQYTILILSLQLVALWALRERRLWLLALCCALIVTKPNQGLVFAVAMLLLARHWRQQLLVGAAIWGGSLLLAPRWVLDWLPTLSRHHEVTQQPVLWGLALFAVPLLLCRDVIGAAVMLQFALMPFPVPAVYPLSTVPLSALDDPRGKYLAPLSFAMPVAFVFLSAPWAMALTIALPLTALAALRWWERRPAPAATTPAVAPTG